MKNTFKQLRINIEDIWYLILFRTIKPVLKFIIETEITGYHNLNNNNAASIIVTNHYSTIDVLLVTTIIPFRVYPVMAFDIASGYPFWQYSLRLLAKSIRCIFIHRDGRLNIREVKKLLILLTQGKHIIIAPEGDRSANRNLVEAYNGAAFLAMRTKSNVIPISSYGYENIRTNLLRFRRTKIQISIGSKICYDDFGDLNTKEVTTKIMTCLSELLPYKYRGKYA